MFRIQSLQIPNPGLAFHFPQVSMRLGPQSHCAFLNDEKYKSVIRVILEDEAYLMNGFFDFNASVLTSSSSVVWRFDLPLVNQDVLLAYAIAKGFSVDTIERKMCPQDFVLICQYLQEIPIEHKSFEFIFMHCPFFQQLKEKEWACFCDSQIKRREQTDHHYMNARESVLLNLLTYLCFFPRAISESEGVALESSDAQEYQEILDDLWALAIHSNRNMMDRDLMKCERLFQLKILSESDLQDVLETLKESYLVVKKMELETVPRHFIPFDKEKRMAAEAYLEVVSALPASIYHSVRCIDDHFLEQSLEASEDDLTLTMSLELPRSSEFLDYRLAMQLADDEYQRDVEFKEQLQQDEEVAKALQKEFDEEPPIDNMRLFRPLINVMKTVFFREPPVQEPQDLSLLKTYGGEKLDRLIDLVLSNKSYLEDQEGDVLNIKAYEASLLQLKSYYSAAALVPEILGHLTKAQVMTIFRFSEENTSSEQKVKKLFQEWNDGYERLPGFLKETLRSIDGYIIYEKDEELINIMTDLFDTLSFEHVKSLPNVLAERDQTPSVLYYLIRIAALQSIFE